MALHLYAEGCEDTLPGPAHPVPRAGYDATSRDELAWYLAEPLGYPPPSTNAVTVTELLCPAFRPSDSEPGTPVMARTYALSEKVSGRKGAVVPPFGSVRQCRLAPLTLSGLAVYGPPSRLWAMTDADKATVSPRTECWKDMPYRPVHGRARSRLYFDGHVEVDPW